MDLSDLTPQQAHELAQHLRLTLGYLVRLTNRMQQRGWSAADPAYAAASKARDAVHELCVHLHYRGTGMHSGPQAQTRDRGSGRRGGRGGGGRMGRN